MNPSSTIKRATIIHLLKSVRKSKIPLKFQTKKSKKQEIVNNDFFSVTLKNSRNIANHKNNTFLIAGSLFLRFLFNLYYWWWKFNYSGPCSIQREVGWLKRLIKALTCVWSGFESHRKIEKKVVARFFLNINFILLLNIFSWNSKKVSKILHHN